MKTNRKVVINVLVFCTCCGFLGGTGRGADTYTFWVVLASMAIVQLNNQID